MSNYLELGSKVLRDRMQSYAGITVTYKRAGTVKHIPAVPARVVTDQIQESGVVYREVVKDFIISQGALSAFDPPQPQRGDTITHAVNDETHVYLVTGEGGFTSHYEDADSYGSAWRVHTKRDRRA